MLEMRFLRAGRRNKSFFRIVLTEKSKPCKSGFIKILGWYDPHTKESSFDKEEILAWANKGAWASNSVAKLLNENKIEHKCIKFKPKAPKDSKKEEVAKEPKKVETTEETSASDEAVMAPQEEATVDNVTPEETPVDDTTEKTEEK